MRTGPALLLAASVAASVSASAAPSVAASVSASAAPSVAAPVATSVTAPATTSAAAATGLGSTGAAGFLPATFETDLAGATRDLLAGHPGQSAATTLERGELSLLTRAWLADHAAKSMDVQYFIWTADNVGRLAMESLLRAADRGVKVRVLVDDFMLDTPSELLLALDGHPGMEVRVYNPNTKTGVGFWRRIWNLLTSFRDVNQRMHNKGLIVDGALAVTGGRNLADEYFDFHRGFDFRDRDLLVAGPVVDSMGTAFEVYWASSLARPVAGLLSPLPAGAEDSVRASIRSYAADTLNFAPDVRAALRDLPGRFGAVIGTLAWGEARFITDAPGKNSGDAGLGGGGETTRFLAGLLREAKRSVTIQTPYLIPDDATLALFRELTARGVSLRISTNSLANNDNLQAVSGYRKRRKQILAAGATVCEYKPHPGIQKGLQERLGKAQGTPPVFVLHAKTLVVDSERVFIGTFNLDPRSMHLNTESGILFAHAGMAREVEDAIAADMAPENSWDASVETGDSHAPWTRRLVAWLWSLLPIEPVL